MHGLIHLGYITQPPDDPKYPFRLTNSWLVHSRGMTWGKVLAYSSVVGFLLAALAIAGFPGLEKIWAQLLIFASIASLLLLIIFWHKWLLAGILIDLLMIYGVLMLNWAFVN